jgi:hypothetical protein
VKRARLIEVRDKFAPKIAAERPRSSCRNSRSCTRVSRGSRTTLRGTLRLSGKSK